MLGVGLGLGEILVMGLGLGEILVIGLGLEEFTLCPCHSGLIHSIRFDCLPTKKKKSFIDVFYHQIRNGIQGATFIARG